MSPDREKGRPTGGKAAPNSTNESSLTPLDDIARHVDGTSRSRWARRMIGAVAKPLPSYGSPEWVALPEGDRRKVAAVVVAAECWARDLEHLAEDLRSEFHLAKQREDADYQERHRAHRDQWARVKLSRGAYADRMREAS